MKEDDVVESFFKGMKKKDEYLSVPMFREPIKPQRRKRQHVFLLAAATLVTVMVALILVYKDEDQKQNDPVVILIGEDEMNTNSLIEQETFSEWNSPTNFLAEDF